MYSANFNKLDWEKKLSKTEIDFGAVVSSLSGNHNKIEMKIGKESLEPVFNDGDVIVKDSATSYKIYEKINANEHFFTYLASSAGIETTRQILVQDEDDFLLFSERFDKGFELIHISEFLRLDNYVNFELKDFVEKIDKDGYPQRLKKELARQIFFNMLIGNLDTHANNFSLLKDKNGEYKVSPMYDISHTDGLLQSFNIVNTKHLIRINKKNKDIKISDLLKELKLNEPDRAELLSDIEDIIKKTEQHFVEIFKSYMQKETIKFAKKVIKSNLNNYKQELEDMKNNNKIKLYHGDNFKTKELDSKLMLNGNNQEGVGIYFGTLDVAKSYGKNIIEIELDRSRLVPSRAIAQEYISETKICSLLDGLKEENPKAMVGYLQDWGKEVYEIDGISSKDIMFLAEQNKEEEIRNLQIELAQRFGVENFVKVWNKEMDIDGTYDNETGFYAVINTDINVVQMKNENTHSSEKKNDKAEVLQKQIDSLKKELKQKEDLLDEVKSLIENKDEILQEHQTLAKEHEYLTKKLEVAQSMMKSYASQEPESEQKAPRHTVS